MLLRRFAVIACVILITLSLMAVKNLVLTGDQELNAIVRVDDQQGNVPSQSRVEVALNDLAGREVYASQNELDILERRLRGEANPSLPEIAFVEESLGIDSASRRMVFTLAEAVSLGDLQRVVAGEGFRRRNPPQPLWYTPLGIDLRGGVDFRLALYDDDGQRVAADDDTVSILRDRLDARGLSEPQVSRLSNGDIQVVIPGGTQADAARTRRILQTAGRLEFREVIEVFGGRGQPPEPGNAVIEVEPGVYRLDPSRYMGFNEALYPQRPQFRGEQPRVFYRLGPARLSGQDVESAHPTTHQGRLAVSMTFSPGGAIRNNIFTTSIHSRGEQGDGTGTGRMAISLDRVVESAPVIINPSGRNSLITGSFSAEEVDQLITVLKAGSLTVTPQVLAERIVGPSLGADTVNKAAWAMFAALLLILVGMGAYYRRLGIVAVVSLTTATLLVFGVLVVFGATLTLPGIAGLVLTVGMAVDANILIFERIREEMHRESDLASCIEAGYGRALGTIIDANVTTFLVALILYMIGSGPIQGFGLTLMIGIATSMFAAVYVGRTITLLLYRGRKSAVVPDYVGELRFPYVKWRFAAFALSAIMMVVGFLEFFVLTSVNNNFDIDFIGGTQIQATFTEEMDLERIRTGLQRAAAAGYEHLDPSQVQLQPYFQGFAGTGGATRQWVFKARDVEAAQLEGELSELETQVSRLIRDANLLRTQDTPDEVAAAELDRQRQGLTPRIEALQERLGRQAEEVARQLREAAFPGLIGEPGSEIAAAVMQGRELQLDVLVIDPLNDAVLNRIAERLQERDAIATAQATAEEDRLRLHVTFTQPPSGSTGFDLDEAAARRLQQLLSLADVAPERVNGYAIAAFDVYTALNTIAANERIRTAQPFPSQEHFSGLVAAQMKWQASLALAIALLGILLYVAARFEFRYGIGAVVALFHDIPITLGLLVLTGVRIDLTVVAALLTIIGYSLNDTIVVFDRIREIRKFNPLMGLAQSIDSAIAQTMSRTVMTTATTLSVVLILFFFGGEGLRAFSTTLIIGLILGTYSSVFIAAPVLLFMDHSASPEDESEQPVYGPGGEYENSAPVSP